MFYTGPMYMYAKLCMCLGNIAMCADTNTTRPVAIQHLNWMLKDALRHAAGTAARAQEATEGTSDTLLFDAARVAIAEFSENHPAMRALASAALRGRA